ncbi:hypothetical protein [Maribacter halichondriae]|uniref:hypothetical protein n=1 Tax=Maribacter halichondriae TaxID=2980554 RepID=UPI0023581AC6|nr:hypothetical protein [Maribacter sp. Hal144]
MEHLEFLHKINISIHVVTGLIALMLGITALSTLKGGKAHRKSGSFFLYFLTIVVVTGLFGVLIFEVNQFLMVITILSGYNAYSGIRVLQNKTNQVNRQDILVALLSVSSGIYFLYYMKSIGMVWSPTIIYATLSALFLVIAYDLLRYLIPKDNYKNLWLYEHIYKMVSAFTALLAAATGTIYDDYHPYSQILPSVFGTLLAIGFIVYFYRRNNPKSKIRELDTNKTVKGNS